MLFRSKFLLVCRESPVKFNPVCSGLSAQMPKRKKATKKAAIPLDTVSQKKRRGRPGVRASEVRGRGDHYRQLFRQIWADRRKTASGEDGRGYCESLLADSLAGRGSISPRRSRDICDQERKKKVHYIIRQDYYIECTGRYKGPAFHRKCPKCGTDRLALPYSIFDL